MTFGFDSYPVGRDILFLHASLDDVRWVMKKFPSYWTDYPGDQPFYRPMPEIQFKEFYRGVLSPRDWLSIYQPQNFNRRYLFVDISLPGWIAVIIDSKLNIYSQNVGRGIYQAIAERDGIPSIDDPLGVAQIHVRYRLLEPSVEHGTYYSTGDMVSVKASSTTIGSPFVKDESYLKGLSWSSYRLDAYGLPGYDGLDVPLIAEIPDHIRKQYPPFLTTRRRKQLLFVPSDRRYGVIPEAVADFQRVLPFDHRGQERIVDFFNSSLVSAWLADTYGIRWNDPSFYEGESLLYIVSGPEVLNDPFTPRIPLADFYRFQDIDLERNRALIARGKF